jgi:hypothetical protein
MVVAAPPSRSRSPDSACTCILRFSTNLVFGARMGKGMDGDDESRQSCAPSAGISCSSRALCTHVYLYSEG